MDGMIERFACEFRIALPVSPLSRSRHGWILENILQIETSIPQRPVTYSSFSRNIAIYVPHGCPTGVLLHNRVASCTTGHPVTQPDQKYIRPVVLQLLFSFARNLRADSRDLGNIVTYSFPGKPATTRRFGSIHVFFLQVEIMATRVLAVRLKMS